MGLPRALTSDMATSETQKLSRVGGVGKDCVINACVCVYVGAYMCTPVREVCVRACMRPRVRVYFVASQLRTYTCAYVYLLVHMCAAVHVHGVRVCARARASACLCLV